LSKGPKQAKRFHEPLVEGETAQRTVGCRHTNPDICAKHSLPAVCAFARSDGMCLAPPASWPKQYEKLRQLQKPKAEGS
jgi:predicted nucleic acid binding AN1-type Zn finger protein